MEAMVSYLEEGRRGNSLCAGKLAWVAVDLTGTTCARSVPVIALPRFLVILQGITFQPYSLVNWIYQLTG